MAESEVQPIAGPPAHTRGGPPAETVDEEAFSVRTLRDMFVRHLWGFVTVSTLVFLAGLWLMFKDPPIYQARAQVKVEEKKQVFTIQEFMDFEKVTSDFYKTQVELLQSRDLCRSVIESLQLQETQELAGTAPSGMSRFFKDRASEDQARVAELLKSITGELRPEISKAKRLPDLEESAYMTRLVDRYIERLTVKASRQTPQLINVNFRSESPFLAAAVANVHVRTYINRSSISNAAYTADYIRSVREMMKETNQQIEKASNAIVEFKQAHNLFQIGDAESSLVIQDIDDRLTRVRSSLTTAKEEKRSAVAAYEAVFEPGHVGNPLYLREEVLDSHLLQTLLTKRSEAEQEWILIQSRYLERHPKYIAAQQQLDALDEQIEIEKKAIVEKLQTRVQETSQRTSQLMEEEQQLIKEKYKRDAEVQQLQKLERDLEALVAQHNRQMEDLQNAEASIEAREGTEERTFEIVDYAEIPLTPINRDLLKSLLMTIVAAVGAGLCGVLFLEYEDQTIRTPVEVERYTGVPMLGCIPIYEEAPEDLALRPPEEGRISVPTPEAFVALRTAILFSALQTRGQVIMVTSSLPGEGKSMTAVNLAFALARSGKKTAIVDGDLRTPRVHNLFGEFREPGFVDLLFQTADVHEVVRETEVPNAFLVSAGSKVDRPADLLSSDMPQRAIEELRTMCDFLILDTSPVLVVPDASILSACCDRTLMVVNCGKTTRDAVNTGIDHIRTAGGDVSGIVLNRVPRRERQAFHHYGYGYGYGYTYGEEAQPSITG